MVYISLFHYFVDYSHGKLETHLLDLSEQFLSSDFAIFVLVEVLENINDVVLLQAVFIF